jgi:hypothetical protein
VGLILRDEIMKKIYDNEQYLDFLRRNPKWYYYLDQDPKNYKLFEENAKKVLRLTSYDKLDRLKKQVSFASAMINYFTK